MIWAHAKLQRSRSLTTSTPATQKPRLPGAPDSPSHRFARSGLGFEMGPSEGETRKTSLRCARSVSGFGVGPSRGEVSGNSNERGQGGSFQGRGAQRAGTESSGHRIIESCAWSGVSGKPRTYRGLTRMKTRCKSVWMAESLAIFLGVLCARCGECICRRLGFVRLG